MKVLLTGSCGFIFSNFVIYALQKTDWELISVDKITYAGSLLNVPHQIKRHKLYIGDVCDYHFIRKVFEIEKPDIVIHGAADSHVDNSIQDSSVFVQTNIAGTHSMLEASLKVHTPQKFIAIESDEVYGSLDQGYFKETDVLNPRNPYAASKAAAGLLSKSYFTTFGLPVITTRCCNNMGPRQHVEKFIPKAITNLLQNKKIPLYGDGKNKREWIYVMDHFEALKTIIEKGVVGETYNIGTGQEKENIEVLETILELMGKGKENIEYVKDRLGHDRRYAVDSSKIRALGWKPEFEFKESLAHVINWYHLNRWFLRNK